MWQLLPDILFLSHQLWKFKDLTSLGFTFQKWFYEFEGTFGKWPPPGSCRTRAWHVASAWSGEERSRNPKTNEKNSEKSTLPFGKLFRLYQNAWPFGYDGFYPMISNLHLIMGLKMTHSQKQNLKWHLKWIFEFSPWPVKIWPLFPEHQRKHPPLVELLISGLFVSLVLE